MLVVLLTTKSLIILLLFIYLLSILRQLKPSTKSKRKSALNHSDLERKRAAFLVLFYLGLDKNGSKLKHSCCIFVYIKKRYAFRHGPIFSRLNDKWVFFFLLFGWWESVSKLEENEVLNDGFSSLV